MPLIQVTINSEEDVILSEAARIQGRSKRKQLAFSAITHARAVVSAHRRGISLPAFGDDDMDSVPLACSSCPDAASQD